MKLKGIIFEDFVNYKKPSMTLEFPTCNWKCDKEYGGRVCQNSTLATLPNIDVEIDHIIDLYINNDISKSIVCLGLEPMDSYEDLITFITCFRKKSNDDIVIYTGYNQDEIQKKVKELSKFDNIIIKFGRYIPNQIKHYDDVLGVMLASDNQHAIKIS